MEDLKSISVKLSRMERAIDSMAKSLETIAKVMNRQYPKAQTVSEARPEFEEDIDDE